MPVLSFDTNQLQSLLNVTVDYRVTEQFSGPSKAVAPVCVYVHCVPKKGDTKLMAVLSQILTTFKILSVKVRQ